MKKNIILTMLLSLALHLAAQERSCGPSEKPNDDRLSETLGHLIVRQLDQPGFAFNIDRVIQGMRDEREGKPAPLSEDEYEQIVNGLQEQHFLQTAEQNLVQANDFLQENALKIGVQAIDPKLQYIVTQEGMGESIDADSVPLIHYKGQLIDGTIFASSEEANQPVALPIKQSIPGFAKGLVGMKEGEKRVLYIHPELAYGLSGHLPPNSLLIFEVEIVKANALPPDAVAQAH